MTKIITELEEQVILQLIAGKSNYAIADELNISYDYVKYILKKLYKKFDVPNRTSLVVAVLPIMGNEFR